jgi:uncharacterized protein
MKLKVDRITPEPRECRFDEPEEVVNQRLASAEVCDFRLTSPIVVDLSSYRAGDDLCFRGSLATAAEATCARCAEPFSLTVRAPFEFVLAPAVKDAGTEELSTEDLALSFYSGDEVDLGPLVADQAILALPTRPLCAESCRGLCPECGANRNLGDCGCRPEAGDPRLAALRTLGSRRAS